MKFKTKDGLIMVVTFVAILFYLCYHFNCHGGIGEVVNTPDCGSGMRGFDPHISPHVNRYYAQKV